MQDENEMRLQLIQYIYILQYICIHLISLSNHIYDALDEKWLVLKNEFSTDKANEAIIVHMVYEGVAFKIARFKIMTYHNLLSVVYLSIKYYCYQLPCRCLSKT